MKEYGLLRSGDLEVTSHLCSPHTLLQLMLPFVGDRHSVTEKEPGPKRESAHSGLIPNNIPSTQV